MSIHCYSVMGEPDCLGIVPRFCEELFERIEGTKTVEVLLCQLAALLIVLNTDRLQG